ncbi:hypothetical protein [Zavarzinella formosa]|uniref:hypothetical protein n=1 Tax=Zavarzinella formosa TaxID=360055 RepID=UPI00035F20D6|nr:hypothetical protein [Zavarzinella formosa]
MRATLLFLMLLSSGCKHCFSGEDCNGAPEIIRVKAPRQKIIVETPEDCPGEECETPPTAGLPAPKPAPRAGLPAPTQPMPTVIQAQPSMMAGAPMVMASPGVAGFSAPQSVAVANTEQTIRAPRTRWALGLTTINIPFPTLKLFDVPVPGEVTTTTTIPTPPPQQIQLQQQNVLPVQQFAGMPMVQQVAGFQMIPQQQQFVGMPMIQQQPQFAGMPMVQPQFAGMPMIQQQPQFAGMPMIQQQPQQPMVAGIPPQPQPMKAGLPAAADCPPVSKETLDNLEKEIKRARELIGK